MGSEMVVRAPLEPTTMDEAARLAQTAAASGLFAVRRPEEALVILLTGRELGLGAMAALRGIYVVSGRPVLSADLLVACVRRSGLCKSWRVVESTAQRCEITTQRVDEEHPSSKVWTAEDARRAGLSGRGTWAAYPGQMLRHRCAADLAREVYPEVALGLYDPDEIEGVPVRQDSRRVETIPAPAEEPTEDAVEEGSRAVVVFEHALDEAGSIGAVPDLWGVALTMLRHEGHAPEEWTATLASVLDAWLTARGYRTLSAADRTALCAGHLSADLMAWHDTLAALLPLDGSDRRLSDDEAARLAAETWLASRWASLPTADAQPARIALQRWMAATLGRPEDTRGAGTLLAATVQRLRAERAAAVDALTAATSEPTRAREPGDDDDEPPPTAPPAGTLEGRLDAALGTPRKGRARAAATQAVEDTSWQGSREGMERHACGLRDVHAVRGSAIKHRTLVGYASVLASRLMALDPGDEHGTRESYESALRRVNGWMAQAQSAARRAA